MIFEPDTVKGFQDYLPPLSQKRAAVRKVIEKWYKLYGFLPIETPTLEFDELMKSDTLGDEDEAVSDRFRLKDKGGRNLGMRYEFTFQLKRILKQNPNLKMPFRRYQIGPVFRDEPTGTGRFREFNQCDIDIVGDPNMEADVECLAVATEILNELKVDSEIYINNRKLMNAIIDSVQIQNKEAVMREIDKLDKLGEDAIKSNLLKHADSTQIVTLFKLLEKDLTFFVKNMFEGAEEVLKVIELGREYGLKIKFDPYTIRGLSYYTGNVFEIKQEGKSSIAAGGRYDNAVGKFLNKQIPAVGISFGLERLTEIATVNSENTKAVVISINQRKPALKLTQKLRKEGIPSLLFTEKVGKALEYADSYSIPYVIFVGEEEVKAKKFKLRNMKSGEERLLLDKSIIKELKN